MAFTRITVDPAVCTGKPCIRHLRFPVARLLGLLAAGETREQILTNYPYLEPEDIDEVLRYAAFLAEATDAEILSRARQEARTVITADLDYSRLLALARVTVPSLILFRGGNWSEIDVIKRMHELLQGLSEIDIEQSMLIVDRQRVRRRRLPLLG